MADRNPGDATGLSAILNGALIIVTIAGFLTLVRQELTSDRPAPPPNAEDGGIGSQTVDVRLWEDPLRPSKKSRPQNLLALVDEIRRHGSSQPIWLLPIMVSGGPYSEDEEGRIRTRFAVVSALGLSGYVPRDEEHVGSVVVPWPPDTDLRGWSDAEKMLGLELGPDPELRAVCADVSPRASTELSIRYEWYRARTFYPWGGGSGQPEVLVLWLDDRFFQEEPLFRLPLLLAPLIKAVRQQGGDRDEPVVRLIGPENSSTLRAMLPHEFVQQGQPPADGPAVQGLAAAVRAQIEIYSATASAMDEVLVTKSRNTCDARREPVREKIRETGVRDIHFFNMDDARIADEILSELELRGVRLSDSGGGVSSGPARDHIVLLSEWDTFYGRMLSLTYGAALAERSQPGDSRSDFVARYMAGGELPKTLHTVVYLR